MVVLTLMCIRKLMAVMMKYEEGCRRKVLCYMFSL